MIRVTLLLIRLLTLIDMGWNSYARFETQNRSRMGGRGGLWNCTGWTQKNAKSS